MAWKVFESSLMTSKTAWKASEMARKASEMAFEVFQLAIIDGLEVF